MKILTGDIPWTIRIMNGEEFVKIHGDSYKNIAAVTDTGESTIDFKREEFSIEVIRHELFHAFFTLALVNNVNLTKDETEEVSADVIGKYGDQLIKLSNKIYKWGSKK